MIILDKPYVSDFLKNTILQHNIPVLCNQHIKTLQHDSKTILWEHDQAVHYFKENPTAPIYTPSENSIEWITENLTFTDLPNTINAFKDKIRFRTLLKEMVPDFYFRQVDSNQLDSIDISAIPKPFIIKPAVGFFSMGVYRVNHNDEWPATVLHIKQEIESIHNLYPAAVLDTNKFIIEEIITGTEFAFDAYFNQQGQPVILTIFEHFFASNNDVSDRVYVTSGAIIQKYLEPLTFFMRKIGELIPLKNFPMHVEVRIDDNGVVRPIEINPQRFGGWCTTADATFFAYDFNPYDYFFNQKIPNWESIIKKNDAIYSIIVLDNSTGTDAADIQSFDYKRLLAHFEKPIELRKIDYCDYPVFGFIFTETRVDNMSELEYILKSDLKEFVKIKA